MAQYLSIGWFKALGIVPALFIMGFILCKANVVYLLGVFTITISILIGSIYGILGALNIMKNMEIFDEKDLKTSLNIFITKENIIFLIFIILVFVGVYFKVFWFSVSVLVLILVLLKLSDVTKIVMNIKGFIFDFDRNKKEKIKGEIEENEEKPTKKKIEEYIEVENNIIKKIHERIGGNLRTKVRYILGEKYIVPTIPKHITGSSVYTPDAVIEKDKTLYFVEVKKINSNHLVNGIVSTGISLLEYYMKEFLNSFGDLDVKGILAIAIPKDLKIDDIEMKGSENIDIEIIKY